MAIAYGVRHKCLLQVGGVPMLVRVVQSLDLSGVIDAVYVSTDSADVYRGLPMLNIEHVQSLESAPESAIAAVREIGQYPIIITTGDHALLTPEMVRHVCAAADDADADFTVGLATKDTVMQAYPDTKRTFFRLGPDQVSGCNLFTIHNERGLRILEFWREMEQNRKKPWKLALGFGVMPLLRFALGRLTLETAFDTVSQQLGLRIKPLLLPFAEAAIDVDKPADKELAEAIIAQRPR
jgi:GTP:adenosylcobinamide-phosphate guanylyltransferase